MTNQDNNGPHQASNIASARTKIQKSTIVLAILCTITLFFIKYSYTTFDFNSPSHAEQVDHWTSEISSSGLTVENNSDARAAVTNSSSSSGSGNIEQSHDADQMDHLNVTFNVTAKGISDSDARAAALRKLDRTKQTVLASLEPKRHFIHDANSNSTSRLTICNRTTNVGVAHDFYRLQQNYNKSTCPGTNPKTNPRNILLLLDGQGTYGRTSNNIYEFLRALQYSRDNHVKLGIMYESWVTRVILKMWMAIDTITTQEEEDDWISRFEQAFCLKVFKSQEQLLKGRYFVQKIKPRDIFYYKYHAPLEEYIANQEDQLRTLWQGYNKGKGVDAEYKPVLDMCSGIDAVFNAGDDREKTTTKLNTNAIYSVIHSRSLEKEGPRRLVAMSKWTNCDPKGALEMRPEYIKSILKPLGMVHFPIVVITDGQNEEVIQRLRTDTEIGSQLRLVPSNASWIGGDMTLALMSNVFIGNPTSTFSGFIVKSRLAMGFGHNYLFRAKNETGEWVNTMRAQDIFDRTLLFQFA